MAKVAAGRTAMSVATEIGAAAELLYRWKKDLAAAEATRQKSVKELEAELRAMRKRAEHLGIILRSRRRRRTAPER